jgi:hypothetical protein
MALDRTWYNTLVDDDGSGLTGSVWDKADVNQLMNATDAEFNRLISGNIWTPVLQSGGGTPIYTTQRGHWAKSGQMVTVSCRITLSSKGSLAAGTLLIGGLPFPGTTWNAQAGLVAGYYAGLASPVTSIFGYIDVGVSYAALAYGAPAGATSTAFLSTAMLGNTFDLIFGGCYRTD